MSVSMVEVEQLDFLLYECKSILINLSKTNC